MPAAPAMVAGWRCSAAGRAGGGAGGGAVRSGGIRLRWLTGHLRNHGLELLRGLHLLQLSQKLIGGGKAEHISLLLDRGS